MSNIFLEEFEQEAIKRIQKFAKLANSMKMEVAVGFSGGKDSLVVYHLCKRSGIDCKFYFNHSLECAETLKYIREQFPDVIWRRTEKGFFEYLQKERGGNLPTPTIAWCCETYKHNPKFADDCCILGVRRAESVKRKNRKVFEAKNKTILKKNKALFNEYFEDRCQGFGASSKITLKPIVDWSDSDVWEYIKKYNLPLNPLYAMGYNRVGCMICPKARFKENYKMLIKYPKLVSAVIGARERANNDKIDWFIKTDNKDYSDDKVYYVCRWLNHGYAQFSKKEQELYNKFKKKYYEKK